MPYPSLLKDIDKMHPNAQAAMSNSYSQIADAARRLGITPEQYLEREKGLKAQEEENRRKAMDPNKSKGMSDEERNQALNAYKYRRFRELGIGAVQGELS